MESDLHEKLVSGDGVPVHGYRHLGGSGNLPNRTSASMRAADGQREQERQQAGHEGSVSWTRGVGRCDLGLVLAVQ